MQKKGLGELPEVEAPRTVRLDAPVVTEADVDQYLGTAFGS